MGPMLQYASEKPADPIELRIYRGADGAFTLYEDEGDNYGYEKGAYAEIPITWNEASQTLTFGKRKGSFTGMPAKHTFNVIWVSKNHGEAEQVSQKADVEVSYQGRAVTIKAPAIRPLVSLQVPNDKDVAVSP
jgi:alpha-D-xyloside xylohydrolase